MRLEPELVFLPYLVHKRDLTLDIASNLAIYTYMLRPLCAVILGLVPNPACASLLRVWGKHDSSITVHNVTLSNQIG